MTHAPSSPAYRQAGRCTIAIASWLVITASGCAIDDEACSEPSRCDAQSMVDLSAILAVGDEIWLRAADQPHATNSPAEGATELKFFNEGRGLLIRFGPGRGCENESLGSASFGCDPEDHPLVAGQTNAPGGRVEGPAFLGDPNCSVLSYSLENAAVREGSVELDYMIHTEMGETRFAKYILAREGEEIHLSFDNHFGAESVVFVPKAQAGCDP